MQPKQLLLRMAVIASILAQLVLTPFSATPALAAGLPLVDDFEAGLPVGFDGAVTIGFHTFQDPGSTVAIATSAAPPASVPGAASPNNVLQVNVDVVSYAGLAHGFENATVDQWVAQDWSAYAGISFWLYGNNSGATLFVDVLDNRNPDSTSDDAERFSVDFIDNFSGWQKIEIPFSSLQRKEIGNGAPDDGLGLAEVHGWAFGAVTTLGAQVYYLDDVSVYGTAPVRPLTVGFDMIDYTVAEGATASVTAKLSKPSADSVTVNYTTKLGNAVPNRDYTPQSGTLTYAPNVTQQSFTVPTFDDAKYQGERGLLVELSAPTGGAALGLPPVARIAIQDNEAYDPTLLDDFETFPYLWWGDKVTLDNPEITAGSALALPDQGAYEHVLSVGQNNGSGAYQFGRTFPTPEDWSDSPGLNFWWYGENSGGEVQVKLANNQAASAVADPAQWKLVWSDEFDGNAGALPNANVWGYEIGDGTANGIPGWGNDELEYYTNNPDNVATDGHGNLVITTRQADGSLICYYGPCQYTSARLLTKNRFEVAYGRFEARVKVPSGAGLWPAFWMLGADIDRVFWPQTGEIDVMEHVGRLPNQAFGAIHGPGYSGGQSYGKSYDLGTPVADDFHTFAVEWQPDKIVWYVDGIPYHQATPGDPFLQGKQWVFNHPFFMLLNVAVGGNFGGAVGPDTTFPQSTLVDYVRLYQARPDPEEFKASFRDNFAGWQQVAVPFAAFKGDDGVSPDLTEVYSLAFKVLDRVLDPVLLDQVRLVCADQVTVSTTADSGAGSLRKALATVCAGGTVSFAPALGGQTITLRSGPLTLGKNVTVDAAAASGLTISGNNTHRVFIVNSGTTAAIRNLTVANGYDYEVAGGILNNGDLTLDHVVVAGNQVTTPAIDDWQGGGGVYNGDGSKLALVDSTVRNNSVTGGAGGGVYGFFNATVTIERSTISDNTATDGGGVYGIYNSTVTVEHSTISGNTATDVGGGIRSLGNFTIVNSTISGNSSTGWHGGAFFHTDGVMNIANSTVANNTAPAGLSGGGLVGADTGGNATLALVNTIIAGNSGAQCVYAPFGSGIVRLVSLGHNVVTDATCGIPAPDASDRIVADALLSPLADNGGPTQTHALLSGSPAIDAGDGAFCPALDQRGTPRPQGVACDAGSYETVDATAAAINAATVDASSLQSLPEGNTLLFLPLLQH